MRILLDTNCLLMIAPRFSRHRWLMDLTFTLTSTNTYNYHLFDTFWNNTELRGTVFENKLDIQKEAAKDEFEGLVNDINSLIYQFISIK
ncbi:MAG: hypothetical protein IPO04_12685 [Cytophagaceae bacterium]|nr:hypothetical protein [Cytophagaceae bacterium]